MDLAKCKAKLDALNLMNWRMTTAVEAGTLQPYHASTAKVYGTESVADVYHLLLGVIGAAGHLRGGTPGRSCGANLKQLADQHKSTLLVEELTKFSVKSSHGWVSA